MVKCGKGDFMDLKVFLSDVFEGLMTGDPVAMLLVIVATVVIGYAGYEIYWHSTYKYVFSEEKESDGVVVDMDYTPSKNTRVGSTAYYTPPKHNVYILAENTDNIHINHERLYQTVRLGDDVKIKYRDVMRVRRDNPRDSVVVDQDIISITFKGSEVKI
jgi:hypothetical protein